MIVGHYDARAPDLQIALVRPLTDWAVVDRAFANLSLYFLLLEYLAIVGFGGLYSAVNGAGPHAFSHDDLIVTPVTWRYFSMATISTLGFGDVHPTSTAAQIAVGCQIATGPLLLSWLLSVFATRASSTLLVEVAGDAGISGDLWLGIMIGLGTRVRSWKSCRTSSSCPVSPPRLQLSARLVLPAFASSSTGRTERHLCAGPECSVS